MCPWEHLEDKIKNIITVVLVKIIAVLIKYISGLDLRYGTGPPAEFRRVSMRCLSHWSGQQQHLLQWLQALGAQEMQWAQALEKGP